MWHRHSPAPGLRRRVVPPRCQLLPSALRDAGSRGAVRKSRSRYKVTQALCAVCPDRAVVMSATAQITIAAATAVRTDNLSLAIAQPRMTATMGLTYA